MSKEYAVPDTDIVGSNKAFYVAILQSASEQELETVSDRDREVIRAVMSGMSYRSIAQSFGVSVSRIPQILAVSGRYVREQRKHSLPGGPWWLFRAANRLGIKAPEFSQITDKRILSIEGIGRQKLAYIRKHFPYQPD